MKRIINKNHFKADLDHLHEMIAWVRSHAEKQDFSSRDLLHIELAIEEAVVNIILHGYKKREGEIELTIFSNGEFQVVIQDEAPYFNPLIQTTPEDPLQKGGVGINLLLRCMDQVIYQRKGSHNLLILKKHLRK